MKEEDERRLLPMPADAGVVVAVAGDEDDSLDGALTAAASGGDGAWTRRAMQRTRASVEKRERVKRERERTRERERALCHFFFLSRVLLWQHSLSAFFSRRGERGN